MTTSSVYRAGDIVVDLQEEDLASRECERFLTVYKSDTAHTYVTQDALPHVTSHLALVVRLP